jgi:hypothetical protein
MHLLTVVIILLCIAVIILAFAFGGDLFVNRDMGEWIISQVGPCINTTVNSEGDLVQGKCNEPGKQFLTHRCEPNAQSGNACLNGDGSGKQQYGIKIVERNCEMVCQKLKFENITPSDQVCVAKDLLGVTLPANQCFDRLSGSAAITETFKCVVGDDSGINACTTVTPDGSLTVHQLGDVITKEIPCDSFTQSVCGQWVYIPGATGGTVEKSKDIDFLTTPCTFSSLFTLSDVCGTVGGSLPFQEGFIQNFMSCRSLEYDFNDLTFVQSVNTPLKNDSLNDACEIIDFTDIPGASGVCMTTIPTFLDIEYRTGLDKNMPLCGGINGYDNYTCPSACRKWNPTDDENSVYVPYLNVSGPIDIGSLNIGKYIPVMSTSGSVTLKKVTTDDEIFNESLFFLIGGKKIIVQSGKSKSDWVANSGSGSSKVISLKKLRKSYNQEGFLSSDAGEYTITYDPITTVNKPLSAQTGNLNDSGVFVPSGTLTITQERIITILSNQDPLHIEYGGELVNVSKMNYMMFPLDGTLNIDMTGRV